MSNDKEGKREREKSEEEEGREGRKGGKKDGEKEGREGRKMKGRRELISYYLPKFEHISILHPGHLLLGRRSFSLEKLLHQKTGTIFM